MRPEDITEQEKLLQLYRQTLAHYLYQRASLGSSHIPPGIANGINEARDYIRHIKDTLRGWGVKVDNHPNDEEPSRHDNTEVTKNLAVEQKQLLPTTYDVKQVEKPQESSNSKDISSSNSNELTKNLRNAEQTIPIIHSDFSTTSKQPSNIMDIPKAYRINSQFIVVVSLISYLISGLVIGNFLIGIFGGIIGLLIGFILLQVYIDDRIPRWALIVSNFLDNHSNMAKISLLFGILGWVGVPIVGSIIAIITGYISRRQIKRSNSHHESMTLPNLGIAFGYIQIAFLSILLLIFILPRFIGK